MKTGKFASLDELDNFFLLGDKIFCFFGVSVMTAVLDFTLLLRIAVSDIFG